MYISRNLGNSSDALITNEDAYNYDEKTLQSIEHYAQNSLTNKTFSQICESAINERYADDSLYKNLRKGNKGALGQLIEKYCFGRDPNNDERPDFADVGLELKVIGLQKNKNKSIVSKERVVITKINYFKLIDESFDNSHFWIKSHLILFICYIYEKKAKRLDFLIQKVFLYQLPPEDKPTIENDWLYIQNKVRSGQAHLIHCSETIYIEACPKAANAKVLTKQPNSEFLAKPRAFAFKNSYMTYVLKKNGVISERDFKEFPPILKDEESKNIPLQEYVVSIIDKHNGKSFSELAKEFKVSTESKNKYSILIFRMLGVKGNNAEEFVKANVVVKTIRLKKDNKPKEAMSFSAFRFKDIANETWETSEIGNYFRETRFFFVVFREDENGNYCLQGCRFWAMPYEDLEIEYKKVWERTYEVINNGDVFYVDDNGRRHTFFPKSSENRVGHVRPKAQTSKDVSELPNGKKYTRQCFWLNSGYIKEIVSDLVD